MPLATPKFLSSTARYCMALGFCLAITSHGYANAGARQELLARLPGAPRLQGENFAIRLLPRGFHALTNSSHDIYDLDKPSEAAY